MGSRARIVVYAPDEPVGPVRRAFQRIDACDEALSDYRPASESRRLTAQDPGVWRSASPVLTDAISKSRLVWEASDGAFDVTIGAITDTWRRASDSGREPTPDQLRAARRRMGMEHVAVETDSLRVRFGVADMRLDFGGIGKGLAADSALDSLGADGLPIALVEIGGDLVVGDPPPGADGWLVGISDGSTPRMRRRLSNAAVATSGDRYRWTWLNGARASHVLEPSTGRPAGAERAIGVVAPRGWIADAVATVARLRGAEAGTRAGHRLGGAELIELD